METSLRSVPVVATRNMVVFPGITFPLRVAREESVAALKAAQASLGVILALLQKTDIAKVDPKRLHTIGALCKIEQMRGSAEEGYQILARGLTRFEVASIERSEGALVLARGTERADDFTGSDKDSLAALLGGMKGLAHEILRLVPAETRDMATLVDSVEDVGFLTWLCAANIDIAASERQGLLAIDSVKDRAFKMLELMTAFRDGLQVRSEIRDKLSTKLGKNQRDAILREQLRAIKEELGEGSTSGGKDDFRKRIDDANMPEHARKAADEELARFETVGPTSPESHVIRNYLELLVSLPWAEEETSQTIDLDRARRILDDDHYGLDKIKKRILQHLAVMKLKKVAHGSILLFVGPPGVGKTSLGQSIAKALGREFVRASLGGVRDDAEIRGHRRTYVGAMPGRIIQGIKRAKSNNPVFVLDEIDKMGRGLQGDPGGALLEVLDPEQNSAFLDHYLDLTFDLSRAFFIATANSLDGIPGPLLDRMEIIDLTGYTTAEKTHIAKRHLIPKQLEANGLKLNQFEIADEALLRTITHYTREAGVRDLQRRIAAICRASVERVIALKEGELIRIEVADLEEALGPERFAHEVVERVAPPGVVTGLAWTPMGGEILFIEATLMEGSGKLMLTGQLGEVMKESAQIALSVVRSKLPRLVATLDYGRKDVHVHVPAGAIPKDGPSAGVAMLTTIASLFAGRSVSPKLAMTGEVTLRGAVLPVGGVKEKILGAHRAGIERVILSSKNKKDLVDVPKEVLAQMKFDFVDTAAEVLKITLDLDPEPLVFAPPMDPAAAPMASA